MAESEIVSYLKRLETGKFAAYFPVGQFGMVLEISRRIVPQCLAHLNLHLKGGFDMRVQQVMDLSGHTTFAFDETNTVELNEAMSRFEMLTKNGHAAATRKAGERDYTVTKTFDPTADETLFVPAMQGG